MSRRSKETGSAASSSGAHEVGYGRPPVATRFKPGVSGNPNGKRKRLPNVAGQIDAILSRQVAVSEHGVSRKMTLQEVMLTSIAAKAAKGDLRSASFLLGLQSQYRNDPATTLDPNRLSAEDQYILDAFLESAAAGSAQSSLGQAADDADDRDGEMPAIVTIDQIQTEE